MATVKMVTVETIESLANQQVGNTDSRTMDWLLDPRLDPPEGYEDDRWSVIGTNKDDIT